MADSLVTVGSYKYQVDAATAKVLLETEGIPSILQNANSVGALPVGVIELQVRAEDEARARATLATRAPAAPDKCLACGAPMPPPADKCSACGWTFRGDEQVSFANGPVPGALIARVWSPMGSRRFALVPDDVPRYLEWCAKERLEVSGWEMWGRSALGHTLLSIEEEGDAADLLAAAATVPPDRAKGVYFSINVQPRAATAGA